MTMDEAYFYNGVWVRRVMPGDGDALLANMRRKDIEECKALGMSPGRAMRVSIKESIYAKGAWLDGKIVAMWGVGGSLLSDHGCAWMVTGNGVEKIPLTFVKISMREVDKMHLYKTVLSNYVWADYPEAVKFFKVIGFTVQDARPVGKHGNLFHQIISSRA
jgi:hypothetical protein